MALSETLSETSICNQALGRIGANRIKEGASVETDRALEAVQCRLHYETTRDALIRSHRWRFASARKTLTVDGDTPDFEWDYQFPLPDDFMRMTSIYENRFSSENLRSYALEGDMLLTNESSMEIRYIKQVKDVSKFDPLFLKMLVLLLADVLIGPLKAGKEKQAKIDEALKVLMPQVRAMDAEETNTIGKYELESWNDARYA